jgi:hypothetical protein
MSLVKRQTHSLRAALIYPRVGKEIEVEVEKAERSPSMTNMPQSKALCWSSLSNSMTSTSSFSPMIERAKGADTEVSKAGGIAQITTREANDELACEEPNEL